MYIGYIVNDTHPCLKTISESEIPTYIGDMPILIVGFSKAAELFPHITLATKAISEDDSLYYSFSKEESESKYQENLDNFISNCFRSVATRYKTINITSLSGIKIDFKEAFLYETATCVTISSRTKILYINKEIAYFFNKEIVNTDSVIAHLPGVKIISWDQFEFFGAYLKTNNCYKSKEQVRILFSPYGDIDLYMGALCLNVKRYLSLTDTALIDSWQRAYSVESMLSSIKIKVDTARVKILASDDENTIMQTIYKSIENGYIQQTYNGTDKVTGRIYPITSGYSLQSLSRNFRDIIIAEPDCVLVEFDYDAFEYALLSQVCEINITGDPHMHLSQLLFNDDLHRKECKNINYSLLYGKSLEGAIDEIIVHPDLKLSKSELREKLLEVTAPILGMNKKLENDLKRDGFIKNYFGRNIHPEKTFACLNNYIQSTAADILILKLLKLKKLLDKYEPINKIVLQNHDSILLNLSLDTINNTEIAAEIKQLLELPEQGIGAKAGMKYGEDWKTLA